MAGYDGRGARFNVIAVEGNDLSFTVTAVDDAAAAINLSAATITATIYNAAGTVVDQLSDSVGGAGSNIITLSLTDTEVDALTAPHSWALVVDRAGDARTWLAGSFTVADAARARNGTSGTALTATVDSDVNVTATIVAATGQYGSLTAASQSRLIARQNVRTMVADAAHSGHGWVAGGGNTGTLTLNDTSVASNPIGDQCITIVTNGTQGAARVDKTGLTIDMTAKSFLVLLMVEDVTKLAASGSNPAISLTVGDNAFSNFIRFDIEDQTAASAANRYLKDGIWQWVSLQWSDTGTSSGSLSRSGVTQLRVTAYDNNAGAATVHFGGVWTIPEPTATWPNGVCSFTFDDGFDSQLDAIRYLDKYAFPSMILPIVDVVGTTGYLTLDEIRTLRDFSNVDVGTHCYTAAAHNSANAFIDLTDGGADEMIRAKQWALDNGFARGVDFFAYPQGMADATVLDAARDRFSAARSTNSILKETVLPGDTHRIRICELASAKSLAEAKAYIDTAKANKGWVVFMGHKFATPADSITWLLQDFKDLVDYAYTQGIDVRSPVDVIAMGAG